MMYEGLPMHQGAKVLYGILGIAVMTTPCLVLAWFKNKRLALAFLAGLAFNVLAWIYYIFAKSEAPDQEEEETFSCPHCKAAVPEDEHYCPECGVQCRPEKVRCPQCDRVNDADNSYCSACGSALSDEDALSYTCEYCGRAFSTKDLLRAHYSECRVKTQRDSRDLFWFLSVSVTVLACIISLATRPLNVIPILLIFFLVTPLADTVLERLKRSYRGLGQLELDWRTKGVAVGVVVLFSLLLNLLL